MNYNRGSNSPEWHESETSFEFLLGIAGARLQEALEKQRRNPDYLTAWLEHFAGRQDDFASFTLVQDLEHLAETDAEYLDVAMPVAAFGLDERNRLASAEIVEGVGACIIISTKRYDPEQQYLLEPGVMRNMTQINPALQNLDSKLFTYDIVPFRTHEQSA